MKMYKFKECEKYKEGEKEVGNLFRCKYDIESRIFVDNNYSGIFCKGFLDDDICKENFEER